MCGIAVSNRDEADALKDSVSDVTKGSLPAATDMGCSIEPLASVSAASFAETVTSSGNSSEGVGKNDNRLDSGSGSAGNGLNMDDIMEYLQCQDASLLDSTVASVSSGNVTLSSDSSNPALSVSDSVTSTLSMAALQQLASECSTIDLSSFAMDSNVPFVGSNIPASGM